MRIAVITCDAYTDVVGPFAALFDKFWPGCPYPVEFHSESFTGETWCSVVARTAREANGEALLLMQDDFWLTAEPQDHLILRALGLLTKMKAGCVRLYPCPGANDEIGDEYYGSVTRGTVGRTSLQASVWDPHYLREIAVNSMSTTGEAGDLENIGGSYADALPEPVLAFKRERRPWPMEYLCSAVSRGLWNPDAIKLCQQYGIELDRSMRGVA